MKKLKRLLFYFVSIFYFIACNNETALEIGDDGFVYAIDAITGVLNWNNYMQAGQIRSSPVAVGYITTSVHINTTNRVYSLNAQNGEILTQFINSTEGNNLSSCMINYASNCNVDGWEYFPQFPSLVRGKFMGPYIQIITI